MRHAAALAFCVIAASCASAPLAPAPPDWAAELTAAVTGPCAAYVAADPSARGLPESASQAGGVQVLAVGADPADPLCLAVVQGAGAAEAGLRAAQALTAPEPGFARLDAAEEAASFFVLARPGLLLEVDISPNEGVETAAFLVSRYTAPAPLTPAQEAAAAMSLPEAFEAAVFEVAAAALAPATTAEQEARLAVLGSGSLADVYVLRMSSAAQMVGVELLSAESVQAIALGPDAAQASARVLGRVRGEGWSFTGFQHTSGGVLMRCFAAPDGAANVCASDAVMIEAQPVAVAVFSRASP